LKNVKGGLQRETNFAHDPSPATHSTMNKEFVLNK
jgi:hypothetical protein